MQLPPENIYGHTKKLRYILDAIARVAEDTPAPRVMDFGCGNGSAVSQFIIVHADVLEHLDDPDTFLQQRRAL